MRLLNDLPIFKLLVCAELFYSIVKKICLIIIYQYFCLEYSIFALEKLFSRKFFSHTIFLKQT